MQCSGLEGLPLNQLPCPIPPSGKGSPCHPSLSPTPTHLLPQPASTGGEPFAEEARSQGMSRRPLRPSASPQRPRPKLGRKPSGPQPPATVQLAPRASLPPSAGSRSLGGRLCLLAAKGGGSDLPRWCEWVLGGLLPPGLGVPALHLVSSPPRGLRIRIHGGVRFGLPGAPVSCRAELHCLGGNKSSGCCTLPGGGRPKGGRP